ncbi:MAG: diadenylate cyclase CdaA [Clostridia bacterium]|nr:diadenylate cyclase CdaA [Clostridia bacterium]
MAAIKDFIGYIFSQFRGVADVADIIIVSIIVYFVIKFIRDRRASRLATGVIFIIALLVISESAGMRAMNFLFSNIVQAGLIAVIVVFQPELRSALEKVGGSPIKRFSFFDIKNQSVKHDLISNICQTASELSQEYTGALIVLERSTPLGDIIKTGTVINADPNVLLMKNVFFNKAPLHDGAMIIRGSRVYAAGCILPLSTNDDIIKDLGTRHRAAIGMSENSDAVIVVVSEETGTISVAVDGQLRRNFDYNTLKAELSQLMHDDSDNKRKTK